MKMDDKERLSEIKKQLAKIENAIKKEFFAPRPVLDGKIRAEYTWANAAKKTLEVYDEVLNKK